MYDQILKKVMEIIADEADLEVSDITAESTLMEELSLNSMEIMSVVASLEKLYSIRIPQKDLRQFASVRDIVRYIQGKF